MSNIPKQMRSLIDAKCQKFWLKSFSEFWDMISRRKIYWWTAIAGSDVIGSGLVWWLAVIVWNFSEKILMVIDGRWLDIPKTQQEFQEIIESEEEDIITIYPNDNALGSSTSVIFLEYDKIDNQLYHAMIDINEEISALFLTDKNIAYRSN